jgi:hypothetical protein
MRKRSPSPAMVVACLALFVALGGTGYAASAIHTDGGTATIAKKHKKPHRGPRGPRGFPGPGGPGGPGGPAGAPGPAGTAKAYAEVTSRGRVLAGHAFRITDVNILNPAEGIYCFDVSAVGISALNTVPIATADYGDLATLPGDSVQVVANTTFNECPSQQVAVHTYDSSGVLKPVGFTIAFM